MQRSMVPHASPSQLPLRKHRESLWQVQAEHSRAQTKLVSCMRSATRGIVTTTAATGFGSESNPSKPSKPAGTKKGKKLSAAGNVKQSRTPVPAKKDTTHGKPELVRQLASVQGRKGLPQAPQRTSEDKAHEELLKQLQVGRQPQIAHDDSLASSAFSLAD